MARNSQTIVASRKVEATDSLNGLWAVTQSETKDFQILQTMTVKAFIKMIGAESIVNVWKNKTTKRPDGVLGYSFYIKIAGKPYGISCSHKVSDWERDEILDAMKSGELQVGQIRSKGETFWCVYLPGEPMEKVDVNDWD